MSLQGEEKRLNKVFDAYYKGLSNTNIKQPLDDNTILDLFNDFLLTSQIVHSLTTNNKIDLPNLKIFDAGCGNGRMLRKMCELGANPANCIGLDLSSDIIQYARENSPPAVKYSIGDIKEIPFESNLFDIILNFGVLIHIKDNDYIREIAAEFHRALKVGGLVFVTVAKEGSEWGESIRDITRDFSESELLELFNQFECLGMHNTYSNYYTTKEQGNVALSQIMRAFELDEVDTTYKLAVFRK